MVVSNTRQYDNEQTPSQADFPMDDEALVAYLDGELTGAQAAAVETGLQASVELRERLGHLKRAWEMLEELPDEQPNPQFAHSTMELIALNLERDLASGKSRWALVRKLGILSAAGLSLMLIAYMAARQYQHSENRQALNELHILADWNAFKHIDSFEWLEKLESVEDLTVAWPQPHVNNQARTTRLGLDIVPTTTTEKREAWVAELSDMERAQLFANREDFQKKSPAKQAEIREIADKVYQSPQTAERYLKVARAYKRALAHISGKEVDQLADATIDERYATLTRIVNGKMVQLFAINVPEIDRLAIMKWLAEIEEFYDSELPQMPGGSVGSQTGARVMIDLYRSRTVGWSIVTDEDLSVLKSKLSPEAQKILAQIKDHEAEEAALSLWISSVGPSRRSGAQPFINDVDLKAEYDKLSPDEQERIDYKTPRRARDTLQPRSWPRDGRGGSRRGGQGFGGPPPASFMRPGNRQDSSPPTTPPDGSPAGTPPAL